MKFLESHELLRAFVQKYVNSTRDKSDIVEKIIMALITGTILLARPSPNKIQEGLVTGASKATFYRNIHQLAAEMPGIYKNVFEKMQQDSNIKMREDGILSLDEHIIPHSSDEMEGVDWFYSTTEKKTILGLSTITTHYFRAGVEYPVDFTFYRRLEELERHGVAGSYKEKNEIAREMIVAACARTGSPRIIVMDNFFMTKENARLLSNSGRYYVSRPKRNWNCTVDHVKYTFSSLFDTIQANEFKETRVENPKTGKVRIQWTAERVVYIPKAGKHKVVFTDCDRIEEDEEDPGEGEVEASETGRRFRVFVTNNLTWDAAKILAIYAARWPIETSYRDMSQDLNLHGCKWRQLHGQYCFIALTFVCYLFLTWAKVNKLLIGYNDELDTIGQLKEGFSNYCQDRFAEWLVEVKQQCSTCPIANWIHDHVYCRSGRNSLIRGIDR